MARVVLTSVLAPPEDWDEDAGLLAGLDGVEALFLGLLVLLGRDVVVQGARREDSNGAVAVEDLKVYLGQVSPRVLRVMDDLLRGLDPAYGAEAWQNAQPVRCDDEYEDGQRQGKELPAVFGAGYARGKVGEELDDCLEQVLESRRHFGHPACRQVGEHGQHDDSEEGRDHGVGELEPGEELVREHGLRGELDVSDRGGQESAAELVAERTPR